MVFSLMVKPGRHAARINIFSLTAILLCIESIKYKQHPLRCSILLEPTAPKWKPMIIAKASITTALSHAFGRVGQHNVLMRGTNRDMGFYMVHLMSIFPDSVSLSFSQVYIHT